MRYIDRLHRLLWGANIVLLAVALFSAVLLLTPKRMSSDAASALPTRDTSVPDDAPMDVSAGRVDLRAILERDVFGAGQGAMTAKPESAQTALSTSPKSELGQKLPFRLVGTVVDEEGPSYALLENVTTKAQDLYRVGDLLDGARIDRIEQNNVFVSSMGVQQVLTLVLGPADVKAGTAVAVQPPSPPQVNVDSREMLRVVSDGERQINARTPVSSADQAAQFLSKVRLSPHIAEGASDGVRISGLGNSVMAQLAGLKDGDVIHSINGHPVTNQRKAVQVLQKARRLGSAQLELTRGQEKRSLAFHTGSW